MAIGAPVEVGSGQAVANASTIAITLTANVPAGSTLILFSNVLGALAVQTPVSSVADAASNPWAVGLNKGQGGGPEDTDIWFGRMNTGLSSGGTVTVTYSGVGGLGQGIASLAYVTGLDTTSPLDKAVGAVGSSTAPSSGTSGTLTQANEICIGVVGRYNAASTVTLTSIGSFTAMTKQQNSAGTTRCTVWPAYQIVSATTAQTYSGTLSVTGAWEAIQITLKGAATAATPPPPQGASRRLVRLPRIRLPLRGQATPTSAVQPPPSNRRRTLSWNVRLRRRSSSQFVPPQPAFRPPPQAARARIPLPLRRRSQSTTPTGVAGFIAGTHQLPTAASMNLALPPGSVLNGWVLAVEAEGSGTPVTGAIAGSTTLLSAAATNMYIRVLAKQLNATDISNGFLAVTGTTTGHDWWALAYDTTITGFDALSSFPLNAAAFGTRGGVSQTFITAPSATPGATRDYVAVLSFERTIGATTVSSISQGTQDYFNEDVTTTNVSTLAAHFAGPAAGVATGAVTVTYSNASGNGLAFLLPLTTTQSIQSLGPVVADRWRRRPRWSLPRRPYTMAPPQVTVTVTTQPPPPQGPRRRLPWPALRRPAPPPLPPLLPGAVLPRQPARRPALPMLRRAAHPSQLVPPQAIRGFIPAYFYPTLGEWATLTTFPNQPAVMIANPASGPGTSVNSDYTTWIGTAVHSGIQILGYVNLQYATRTLGTSSDTATSGTVLGDINGWLALYPNITGIFFDLSPTDAGANLTFTQSAISYARSVLPNGAPVWINPGAYPLVSGYIDAADVALVYENNYQAGYQGFLIPSWAAGYVPNYPPTKFAHLLYNVPTAQAERVALGIAARNRVGWFFATNSDDTFSTLAPYWATDERFDLWSLNTAVDDPIARLISARRRPGWARRQPRPTQPVPTPAVVVTVQVLPPQSTRQARTLVPRRRSWGAQPVPPPVTVTTQALPPQPARRASRFTSRARARAAQPVPAQVVVVTVQALPPQPTRKARTWLLRRRPQTGQPVPAQTPALTTQALPPQPGRRAPRFSFRARPRNGAPPVQVTVTVPPQSGRRLPRQPVVGHRRGTQPIPAPVVVVTAQSLPPQPTRRPSRFLPRIRPRVTAVPVRVTVTVVPQIARRSPWTSGRRRPRTGQPVPPQIVVTAQTLPAQATRRFTWLPLRRRNRVGQLVPVHVTVIVTPTPPERTYVVPGERRTYVVPAESRAVTVPAESRTIVVPAEPRTITVPTNPRSTTTRR